MGYRTVLLAVAATVAGVAGGCGSGDGAETTEPPVSVETQVAPPSREPARSPEPVEGRKLEPPSPTILLSGETAAGRGFDYVLYGTDEGPWLVTMYRGPHPHEGGGAGGEWLLRGRASGAIEGFSSSADSVGGFIGPGVDAIRVDYGPGAGEVTDGMVAAAWIAPPLLRRAGSHPPLGIFIAQLPDGVGPADVTATALDDRGDSMGTTTWPDFASG